ncbi:MAG: tRNA (adenosine(37)-N6)-dimethylallyltransferase MiaA [Treponema sp.]|nr:MAG: tRNA (adenosine(37)-N6)-dimethylallyltransferase MiaA [Treponema sp.]
MLQNFTTKQIETKTDDVNSIVILGATATGKTSLAVLLAKKLNGEIISVDSRQVYRKLDIGSGKDLSEYGNIPYHVIDICDLDSEYNVYNFQKDFYNTFPEIINRKALPIIAGGTGLYLDSVLRNYQLVTVPENTALREELKIKSIEELANMLLDLNPNLHNKTDLLIPERAIRAIEIAVYKKENPCKFLKESPVKVSPLIFGIFFEREALRNRIKTRLLARLDCGMIDEVQDLLKSGVSSERLIALGLEYKYTTEYLQNKFTGFDEYVTKLHQAICRFAKRQETWFRRMERFGVNIIHIDGSDTQTMFSQIMREIKHAQLTSE